MLSSYSSVLNARGLIVAGPFFPDEPRRRLAAIAGSQGVEFKSYVPSSVPYLKSSDLVIARGGYNTMVEILAYAEKAVIVPRTTSEPQIRAHRLWEMGLVDYIPTADLTPDLSFEKVMHSLASEERPLFEARQARLLPMNGAEVLARACEPLLFKQNP